MSPLPEELINRWETRRDAEPAEGTVYWHILLGHNRELRAVVRAAQDRLRKFTGLHMTPLRWLHITTLAVGPADEVDNADFRAVIARANAAFLKIPPIDITLGRVLYHPEAIVLDVHPRGSLTPILETASAVTREVIGRDDVTADMERSWTPHVTICYSTDRQPAGPIIATLGKALPTCSVSVNALDLVVQRGPERRWDWHSAGTAHLLGPMPPRPTTRTPE